jgi:hypothetical protein
MRVIYTSKGMSKKFGVRAIYIKRKVEKVWGARYLPENTICPKLQDELNRYYIPLSVFKLSSCSHCIYRSLNHIFYLYFT